MPEFVSRLERLERANPYKANYSLVSSDTNESYRYIRIAKIHNDFPVEVYAGPHVVAFMRPASA